MTLLLITSCMGMLRLEEPVPHRVNIVSFDI